MAFVMNRKTYQTRGKITVAAIWGVLSASVLSVELSDQPLLTDASVKPNVMLLFDSSGSMADLVGGGYQPSNSEQTCQDTGTPIPLLADVNFLDARVEVAIKCSADGGMWYRDTSGGYLVIFQVTGDGGDDEDLER